MAAFTTIKDFNAWARDRLAEMDAGLSAMEAETKTATAVVVARSRAPMNEARTWRNIFASRIRFVDGQENESIVGDVPYNVGDVSYSVGDVPKNVGEVKNMLQDAWVRFETEMENWAVAAEQKNTAFDARAAALLGVWHTAAANFRAQAMIAGDDRRAEIEDAITKLELEAARYGEKFESLKDMGTLSWVAMGQVLRDSRAAFERTSESTRAAFFGPSKQH